jgi:hypothetical protein
MQVLGMNPHFAGPARLRVKLTSYIPSTTPSPLDGSFHGWTNPPANTESADQAEGDYPFVFDAPDALLHKGAPLPGVVEVQVAAFAHEMQVFGSEQAYLSSLPEDGLRMASESFIPSGLFGQEGEPRALGMFTGRVLEAAWKTNPLQGRSYWWALVQTLGGQFDVVADPELIANPLEKGNIVQGSFWLSGLIQSREQTPKTGIWSRLFGKHS